MIIKTSHSLYDPDTVAVGIIHLGLGAFHRAHQAVYVEKNLNRHGGGQWGICAANIRSNKQLVSQLKATQCQYHVAEYSDSQHAQLREINAIRDAIFAGDDKTELFAYLRSPATKIVTLTVTEKGYYLTPADKQLRLDDPLIQHDIRHPCAPKTPPGILVEALAQRKSLGLPPFTVLSCDNMPNNGQLTQQAVCALAEQRSPSLAKWIKEQVAFPSSMVDRIVPAMTTESHQRMAAELNCDDSNGVMCEAFSQWVVEDNFPQGRPDWEHDGVQMVSDVHPFETMKLRLLNGSHSLIAYLGHAANYATVAEAVKDPQLAQLIQHYMSHEAKPSLNMPSSVDIPSYINKLQQRFANDSLHHKLSQVAMDGSQKIPQRWFTIANQQLALGQAINSVTLGVAAWILYISGHNLKGHTHTVEDPLSDTFAQLHSKHQDSATLVREVLALKDIFPAEITQSTAFYDAVLLAYNTLLAEGVNGCLSLVTAQPTTNSGA